MERYSKLHLQQLKALNNQIEARLTRGKSIALVNEWRQKPTFEKLPERI